MGKLYGIGNNLISEIAINLMNNQDFVKFVYYKDEKEDGRDILELPSLEDPVGLLYKKQVYANKRVPDVLTSQDIKVTINFEDERRYSHNGKRIKTVTIKIGIVVHDNCLYTANGKRDVAIVDCIRHIVENTELVNGIGRCEVVRVNPMLGIPAEWHGFEMFCRTDVFSDFLF